MERFVAELAVGLSSTAKPSSHPLYEAREPSERLPRAAHSLRREAMTFPVVVCSVRTTPTSLRIPIEWRQDSAERLRIEVDSEDDAIENDSIEIDGEQNVIETLLIAIDSGSVAFDSN
jgi:hypothetical protein